MQLSPTLPPAATGPVFEPGKLVALVHSFTASAHTRVYAGSVLDGTSTFARREDAFGAAYAASLGAGGAVLVARAAAGWVLQHALGSDGVTAPASPFTFESLPFGERPMPVRGGFPAALEAIIDGAAIIVNRD